MIRLTLILTAGIVGAMLIYGAETPELAPAEIEATVLESESAPVAEPVVLAETVVDAAVEVTRAPGIDLTQPRLVSFLSSADAPADASLEIAAVDVAQSTTQEIVYVTGSRVNLRAGPSTGHTVLGKLGRGDVAVVIEALPEGWMRIRDMKTGTVGFMSGDFLSPSDPTG